jgi:NitT/TauT family transport system substrate-binding protein
MSTVRVRFRHLGLALLAGALAVTVAGAETAGAANSKQQASEPVNVRLGYFPNVTHAPALVGVEGGMFQKALGKNTLDVKTFNAGPEEVTALLAGALDIGYIGPNPSVNAYVQSNGEAVRVVGGATAGGAYLVVRPDIDKASDLEGKKVATPQLGNTQDVALRVWLKKQGFKTDTSGGGDVQVTPLDNALALDAFKQNQIAGAWVPEPWATRLINEGGGKILVDERTLWPQGQYVTTNIIVRTQFLDEHPDVVKQVLEGNLAAIDFIETNRTQAEQYVGTQIQEITGKPIPAALVTSSFDNLTFTHDPLPQTLQRSAKDAVAVGLLEPPKKLFKLYDLKPLNSILRAQGIPEVSVKPVKILTAT